MRSPARSEEVRHALTVDLPWLTYPRRLAIMLVATLLLLAVALPASAAPPTATANVTVMNDETNPVPVTVENEVAVTGGNNTPVNVAGEVTVGNVTPITVTGDVNAAVDVVLSTDSMVVNGALSPGMTRSFADPPAHLTTSALSVSGSRVTVTISRSSGDDLLYWAWPGETLTLTYPVPVHELASIDITCPAVSATACGFAGYFAGY